MTTTAALSSRAVQAVVGRGAVARPRYAAVAVAAILALSVGALLLLVRPWDGQDSASPAAEAAQLAKRLSRLAYGPGGVETSVILATPQYLRVTGQEAVADRYDLKQNLVFLMTEAKHDGDLPRVPPVQLRAGGMTMAPAQTSSAVGSVHHRLTVLVFPKMGGGGAHAGHEAGPLEILLPPAKAGAKPSTLSWLPAAAAVPATSAASFQLTWATLLALFGGLLSAMWPCLFQLTVYFVPTLAGLSAADTAAGQVSAARGRLVRTAGAFVAGFVVVYTAAGAAAGFAAESLGGTSAFWSFRRPLAIAAGVVLLLTAVRLAANGRAPLVCKMPLGNFLGRRRVGHLGTMILGVAFAIGCTTCFGAAIVLGMITYVGVAGTPLAGALIMLVFALGMAIPLMLGAIAMARVMSLLGRMEKVAPYMVLGASAIMAGFAVLLLSGRYMALSNFVAVGS